MRTILRCARVWRACFTQAIRRDLQFRSQTITTAAAAVLDVALTALPLWLMMRTDPSSSWVTGTELVGVFNITAALLDAFISPNLEKFSRMVRTGELDLLLIRPLPTAWLAMTRWMRPASLARALTGIALLVLALRRDPTPYTISSILLGVAWALVGLIGWALVCANLSWLAFWMTGTDPVTAIAGSLRDAGQYPLAYFTGRTRHLFTSIAPALLLAAVPLVVARRQGAPSLTSSATGLAIGLTLTAVHWNLANRRYESASS